MLPPYYFDTAASDLVELYSQLDQVIIRDIVRRLTKVGDITATAKWQAERLQESGLLMDDIIQSVASMTSASTAQIKAMFEDAGIESVQYDSKIYEAAGLTPLPLKQAPSAMQILQANIRKTAGYVQNLTMTTASTGQQAYIQAVTAAEMQIESGAFDYVSAIRKAISDAAQAGSTVLYPSGHHDYLDVAVRRAAITGMSQTSSQISLGYADDMGCDLVETTAHPGARPEHQIWQGKVFSRSGRKSKYPDFVESTGYGTGDGLCGWNCRHSFYPYFEGLSGEAYPRDKIKGYNSQTVTVDDKKISYYDATQMQRNAERQIRASKRMLAAYSDGMKSDNEALRNVMKEDFNQSSVKLKQQEKQLRDFLNQTGLGRQREREQSLGFGRSQAQKAVWANKNIQFIKSDLPVKTTSGLPKRIDLPDEKIQHTVPVDLLKLHGVVPEGSQATDVYAMAGKGTSTPIRDLKRLYTQYPQAGPASGWQKKSGTVYSNYHHYVIHWYENNGFVPESEIKLKGAK